jgi:type IV fimbrial biogenesis protein FimT
VARGGRVAAGASGAPCPGFTLVEIVIALAIGALLLALGGVTVQSWLPRYHQRNEVQALLEAMQLARAEALKRGQQVNLCPSADGATCDPAGRWDLGWLVFADEDGDGDRGADEPVVRVHPPAGQRISVTGNRPVRGYVSYTPWGHTRLASGALQMGTFTVCKPGLTAIEVVLAEGGRPRIQEVAARCP